MTSWELGTAAEALTELSWPTLSVFNKAAFPPPARLNATLNATDVLSIANRLVQPMHLRVSSRVLNDAMRRTVSAKPQDTLSLIAGQGSAADPASTHILRRRLGLPDH